METVTLSTPSRSQTHDLSLNQKDSVSSGEVNINEDSGKEEAKPVVLSSNEVIELTKFNQRKVRIIEQTQLLESRPKVEPFEKVPTLVDQQLHLDDLGIEMQSQIEELKCWQKERDSIAMETEEFREEDMNRLRKVCIATSKRHMSTHDTDLIELTLDTLNALDKLLHLLTSRSILLDLALAERSWEADRILWWKEFYSLTSSVENFVARRARWSVSVYSKGLHRDDRAGSEDSSSLSPARSFLDLPPPASPIPSSSSPTASPVSPQAQVSPNPSHHSSRSVPSATSKFMLVDKVELEASRLMARITDLDIRFTRPAAEKLDELMSLGKVPDKLLDEQDKMEDRIIAMNLKSGFIQALTSQWKQADKLYHVCRALHSDAKKTFVEVEKAQARIPSREQATSFKMSSQALLERLQDLAGQAEVDQYMNSSIPLDAPGFSAKHLLPEPEHSEWEDQSSFNSSASSSLLEQLASSAKRTRKAVALVRSYFKGFEAFEKVKSLQSSLEKATDSLEAASLLSTEGWGRQEEVNVRAEKLWASVNHSFRSSPQGEPRPYLGSIEVLEHDRHLDYLHNFTLLQKCVTDLLLQSQPRVSCLSMAVLECVKHGMVESSYRVSAETSGARYAEAKIRTSNAMAAGEARVQILKEFRVINDTVQSLQDGIQELSQDLEAACLQQRFNSSLSKSLSSLTSASSSPDSSELTPEKAAKQLKKLFTDLSQSRSLQNKVEASKIQGDAFAEALLESSPLCNHLKSQQISNQECLERLELLLDWYRALSDQAADATALEKEYLRIRNCGNDLLALIISVKSDFAVQAVKKIKTCSNSSIHALVTDDPSEQSYPGIADQTSDFCSQVDAFYQQASRLKFTGISAPSCPVLPSSDEELRSVANAWSSKLSSLREEIKVSRAEAESEKARGKLALQVAMDLVRIRSDHVQLDKQIVSACGRISGCWNPSTSAPSPSASQSQKRCQSLEGRLERCKNAIEELRAGLEASSSNPIREHLLSQHQTAEQELRGLEDLTKWQSKLDEQAQMRHSLQIEHQSLLEQVMTFKHDLKEDEAKARRFEELSVLCILRGEHQVSHPSEAPLSSRIQMFQSHFTEQVNVFSTEALQCPRTGPAPASTSEFFTSARPSSADQTVGEEIENCCMLHSSEAKNFQTLVSTATQLESVAADHRDHAVNLVNTRKDIKELSSKVTSVCQSHGQQGFDATITSSEATSQLLDLSSRLLENETSFERLLKRCPSSPVVGHSRAYLQETKSEHKALRELIAWFSQLAQQGQEEVALLARAQHLASQISVLKEEVSMTIASHCDAGEDLVRSLSKVEEEASELEMSIQIFSRDAAECFLVGPAPDGSGLSSADRHLRSAMQQHAISLESSGRQLMEMIRDSKAARTASSSMELERQEKRILIEAEKTLERESRHDRSLREKELPSSQESKTAIMFGEPETETHKTSPEATRSTVQSDNTDRSFDESLDLTKTGRTALFPSSSSRKSLSSQGIPSSASIIFHNDASSSSPQQSQQDSDDVFGPVASEVKTEFSEPGIPASTSMTSLRIRITKLLAKISNDEVEVQTVEDGRSQERKGVPLPDATSAASVEENWYDFSSQCSTLLTQNGFQLPQPDGKRLANALEARGSRVRRYTSLATFATKASAGDEAISKLIDSLDEASGNVSSSKGSPLPFDPFPLQTSSFGQSQRASSPSQRVPSRTSARRSSKDAGTLSQAARASLQSELSSLCAIIEAARATSLPVSGDVRVRKKVKMLDKLYHDTSEMVEELLNPGASAQRQASEETGDDFDDAGSIISSSTSVSESIDDHLEERQATYETYESAQVKNERSNSALERPYDQPLTPLPRSRTQSLSSPAVSRTSQRSVSAMLPPRHAASSSLSMTSRLPTPATKKKLNTLPARATPSSSTPRMQANSSSSRLPIRTPSSSNRLASVSSRKASAAKPRSRYRANTQSALDVAVGKIVNNLPIAINVRHASQVSPPQGVASRLDDGFKNETGFYWVGGIDREPRKVFCRILRRSCLVRTGGGWMDLREFLHRNYSKYAEAHSQTIVATGSPQALAAAESIDSSNGNVKWISAQTLAEQNRSSRSPEEEKALRAILRPVNGGHGYETTTPSRRRRVESMPGSPSTDATSSINVKRDPQSRSPMPLIPFTPGKSSISRTSGSSKLDIRADHPSQLHHSRSPTPSAMARRSESPFSVGQRRASSSQHSSLHPALAASIPRSYLNAEPSPDQMHPLVLHRPRITSSTFETPSRPAWK